MMMKTMSLRERRTKEEKQQRKHGGIGNDGANQNVDVVVPVVLEVPGCRCCCLVRFRFGCGWLPDNDVVVDVGVASSLDWRIGFDPFCSRRSANTALAKLLCRRTARWATWIFRPNSRWQSSKPLLPRPPSSDRRRQRLWCGHIRDNTHDWKGIGKWHLNWAMTKMCKNRPSQSASNTAVDWKRDSLFF